MVRQLASLVGCDIHPLNNLEVLQTLKRDFDADQQAVDMWYHKWILEGFTAFEALVSNTMGRYCFGDRVTLADLCLMPQLYNARRWEVDLGPMPKIRAIEAELAKIPAFERAHPDRWGGRSFNDHVP